MSKPEVSVVLGTYNRRGFLKETIRSIQSEFQNLPVGHEIIVVDGGSTDGTIPWLVRQKNVLSIIQHNRGKWKGRPIQRRSWGSFMNLAFRAAQGKYICMLSDDCLVVSGSIANGYRYFEDQLSCGKNVGALAFYWRNWPEDEEYYVGLTLGNKVFVNHGMYLNEALHTVGYIDEEHYHFYYADGDLCLRLWNSGFICLPSPNSYIEHISHANMKARKSNGKMERQDWATYTERWMDVYYAGGKKNPGGWIKKEFVDSRKTVNRFKRALPVSWYMRNCARFIKSIVKNVIMRSTL